MPHWGDLLLLPSLRWVGQELQFWDSAMPGGSRSPLCLNARDLFLWGENISSGCITLWLFHSKTFWTPMLQHLLTQLSLHTYSPFLPKKQTYLQAGWVQTYLELQFSSDTLWACSVKLVPLLQWIFSRSFHNLCKRASAWATPAIPPVSNRTH